MNYLHNFVITKKIISRKIIKRLYTKRLSLEIKIKNGKNCKLHQAKNWKLH